MDLTFCDRFGRVSMFCRDRIPRSGETRRNQFFRWLDFLVNAVWSIGGMNREPHHSSHPPYEGGGKNMIALIPVSCPECTTPLARVSQGDGSAIALCVECGIYGDYADLIARGTLTRSGVADREERQKIRIALGGLRDQAARAEAMDRGD